MAKIINSVVSKHLQFQNICRLLVNLEPGKVVQVFQSCSMMVPLFLFWWLILILSRSGTIMYGAIVTWRSIGGLICFPR